MKHSHISELLSLIFIPHFRVNLLVTVAFSQRGTARTHQDFLMFVYYTNGFISNSLPRIKHLWVLLGQDLGPEGFGGFQCSMPVLGKVSSLSPPVQACFPWTPPNEQLDRGGRRLCFPTLTLYKLVGLFLISNLSSKTAGKFFLPTNKIPFPPFPTSSFLAPIKNSNNMRLQTHS